MLLKHLKGVGIEAQSSNGGSGLQLAAEGARGVTEIKDGGIVRLFWHSRNVAYAIEAVKFSYFIN